MTASPHARRKAYSRKSYKLTRNAEKTVNDRLEAEKSWRVVPLREKATYGNLTAALSPAYCRVESEITDGGVRKQPNRAPKDTNRQKCYPKQQKQRHRTEEA